MTDIEAKQEIENLGGYMIGDMDISQSIQKKIYQTVLLIANSEDISFSEAYQNFKSSKLSTYIDKRVEEAIMYDSKKFFQVYNATKNKEIDLNSKIR